MNDHKNGVNSYVWSEVMKMNSDQKGLAFTADNHRQFWKQDLHLTNCNLLFEYVLQKL